MATYVNLRALNRSAPVRVTNAAGTTTKLSTTVDTKVDLDVAAVRRQLNRHSSIGQYIVSGATAPVYQTSGTNGSTVTAGSNFNMLATSGIAVGMSVSGDAAIPAGTTVTEVVSQTVIKLSKDTTAAASSKALYFA